MERGNSLFYYARKRRLEQPYAHVSALGVREQMKPQIMRHGGPGWPFYLLICFKDPVSIWTQDGQEIRIENDVVLWEPFAEHRYGNPRREWNHTWMNVYGTAIDDAVSSERIPMNHPLGVECSEINDKFATLMHEELHGRVDEDPIMVEGIMRIWLRAISRAYRSGKGTDGLPDSLVSARRFINRNMLERITLKEIAEAANLSQTQTNKLFQRHLGTSPVDYVIGLRVERAQVLLLSGHDTVAEVARRAGFDDPLYFSRQFRRKVGMSPRQFRAKQAESRGEADDRRPSSVDVEYVRELNPPLPDLSSLDHCRVRPVTELDLRGLADCYLESYEPDAAGTSSRRDDARNLLASYKNGEHGGTPMLDLSLVALDGERIVASILFVRPPIGSHVRIAFLMTVPAWRNRGIARHLLIRALGELRAQGGQTVGMLVTRGNAPCERLLRSLGFDLS